MAKIDVSQIDGYENMTPEQKVEALLAQDVQGPEGKVVSKEIFDKTASELAAMKRQLREKMSEEERAAAEKAQEIDAMKAELEGMKKEKALSESKSEYIALGYSADLAGDTAKALLEGDLKKVFENQKAHQEAIRKSIEAELLKQNPKPGMSAADNGIPELDAKISKAFAESDYTAQAYYTRLKAQQEKQINK